jgi:nucleoside-triphosphatase
VDLEAFERVALPTLRKPSAAGVVVIDELGKMELASKAFCDAVAGLFDGPAQIVATVHVFRHAFTDALKRRADVERIEVTHANRSHLPEQIASRLGRNVA